jgi:hypothetical protein
MDGYDSTIEYAAADGYQYRRADEYAASNRYGSPRDQDTSNAKPDAVYPCCYCDPY